MKNDPPVRRISRICRGITVEGELQGGEDLLVEGLVKGSIEVAGDVTVGPQGRVEARIQARSVIIQGEVAGNVTAAERLEIASSGRLQGDCRARSIQIETGAIFQGRSEIVRPPEPPSPAGAAAAKPPA